MAQVLYLVPPLYQKLASGVTTSERRLSVSMSPLNHSLAVHACPSETTKGRLINNDVQPHVYLASLDESPASERRTFVIDTSIITASFHQLLSQGSVDFEYPLQEQQYRDTARKLAHDYVNHAKECWVYTSKPVDLGERHQFSADHYRSLCTCFSLFATLYMPDIGFEGAPVADELMEWLNINFIEPSTEEGDHLSALDRPWEDENFWPYLTRTTLRGLSKATVFFLQALSEHPSEHTRRIAARLIPPLTSHPRLQNFDAERDFVIASRRWKDNVKILRVELDRVPESARHDGFENWWNQLSDIVAILEGRGDVVKRICFELGADWKELCAVWGIFVNPRLRRNDLPDVVVELADDMPPDPTNPEDMIHFLLFTGKPTEALAQAAKLDIWLAAHLADIMEPLQLLDADESDETGLSLRQRYMLSYAEYLRSDSALWRIAVQYMYSCGPIGEAQADEVLVRVPMGLSRKDAQKEHTNPGEAEDVHKGDLAGALRALNETCFAYKREAVRRMICKIAARTFVGEKEYGLAVSYYTSAEDWTGVGRVVDQVLEEFLENGPEIFARLAGDIAPSLQQLHSHPGPNGVFIHRLMFVARYAEFHRRRIENDLEDAALDLVTMFQEEIVPKSWWGVLLCDSIDLLQHTGTMLFTSAGACLLLHRLEEIHIRASQGSGDGYLSVLVRMSNVGSEKEGLLRLRPVRLALARYFARCAVIGVGGKDVGIRRAPISTPNVQTF